jgi:hypothetical protein
MGTFLSTSAERRTHGTFSAGRALLFAAAFCGSVTLLRAGAAFSLSGSETDGTFSVTNTGIHVDNSSPTDLAFTDVLEASFGNDPFQLNCFFAGKGDQLPPNWKGQDIGTVDNPGSVTVHDGVFTLAGGGTKGKYDHDQDTIFFLGQSWSNDEIDAKHNDKSAGLMLRQTLDPTSPMLAIVPDQEGKVEVPFRHETGMGPGHGGESNYDQLPLWIRLTRNGTNVIASISTDGNAFDDIGVNDFKSLANPVQIGLFAASRKPNEMCHAVFDHLSITPPPSTAQILPAGVLLQGGSVLAGHFTHLSFDPSAHDADGHFEHNGRELLIARSSIAGVIMLPIERSQLATLSAKAGIVMRNGDTMDGDLTSVTDHDLIVTSDLLGATTYKPDDVRVVVAHPLQPQPAPLEVRLKDGSVINATSLTGDSAAVIITDVSGALAKVNTDEVAQVRAGTAVAQDLAPLAWKATPAADATAPANPAPAAAADSGITTPPFVGSWAGPNQEQILEAGAGTMIDFPLNGKFHSFAVQVALSSDSPPNSTASVVFLVDGQEVTRSPVFHAGDPPRFMQLSVQDPTHVAVRADSMSAGVKVLYIDPVAIRDSQ